MLTCNDCNVIDCGLIGQDHPACDMYDSTEPAPTPQTVQVEEYRLLMLEKKADRIEREFYEFRSKVECVLAAVVKAASTDPTEF